YIAPCLQALANYGGAPVTVGNCTTFTYASRTWTVVNGGAEESTSDAGSATQIPIYGNKCLDVRDAVDQDGTKLQIWTCYDKNTNQLWQVNGTGDISWSGHNKYAFLFSPFLGFYTNMRRIRCMDFTDGSWSDGTA
ncbi:hypothetical protein FRC15_007796, partial [Serendipita sp. 397]